MGWISSARTHLKTGVSMSVFFIIARCILAAVLITFCVSCASQETHTGSTSVSNDTINEPSSTTNITPTTEPPVEPVSALDILKKQQGVLSVEQVYVNTYDNIDLSSYPAEYLQTIEEMIDGVVNKTLSYTIIYEVGNVKVQAFCSLPADYLENPRPLVLYCRGGNGSFSAIDESLTAMYSYYCDDIVLATQYRETSPGTGKDEFGGADIQDVLFWIERAKQLTFADTERIYMLGESRGGMELCLALRDAPAGIVKAAASVSGVYDLAALYEAREDMRAMLTRRIGGTPETVPEEYALRSAITFVDQINTPLLIVHSTGDERVPYSQAKTFADAFEKSGKIFDFWTRENNAHSIASPEEMKSIIAWLENY